MSFLKLLLPVVVPSWRFFDFISASPRVEFRASTGDQLPDEWRLLSCRPERLSWVQYLRALIWNPRWNDELFLVSCAERLLDKPTPHSEAEISTRILRYLHSESGDQQGDHFHYQFRIMLVSRVDKAIHQQQAYLSPMKSSSAS